MGETEFGQVIEEIVASLRQAGYNPYDQLTGYLQTGDVNFITRWSDARAKIALLDKEQIRRYIAKKSGGSI